MLNQKLTGSSAAEKTYVEDVFSTYLYTGNGSTQTINNGIALGDSATNGTVLQLTGDTLTDSAPIPNTLTTYGGVQVSTSTKKYGTGSIAFGGVDGYITGTVPKLTTGDWTIEFWMNCPTAQTGQTCPIYLQDNSGGYTGIIVSVNSARQVSFTLSWTGGWDSLWNTFGTYTDNTWCHVAVVRSGSTVYGFFNGVLGATVTGVGDTLYSTSDPAALGRYSSWYLNGYIDDLRITKGHALYTSNFTPPTQALPLDTLIEGEGGMIWCKPRSTIGDSWLFDTERGATTGTAKCVSTNRTDAQYTSFPNAINVNSTGFTLGASADVPGSINASGVTTASWTFRKAPKFFDVVTYTGDGTTGRYINHNLGTSPGMVMIKATSTTGDWYVWHRYNADQPSQKTLKLNSTTAELSTNYIFYGAQGELSATKFGGFGNFSDGVNINGVTYVAYLFAHDTEEDGMIQCGSFTYSSGNSVNLGWEPQYFLLKRADGIEGWFLQDTMRGWTTDGTTAWVLPNTTAAEVTPQQLGIKPESTGFSVVSGYGTGATYIYMAIRRPMKVPTDGTKVFSPNTFNTATGTQITTSFPVDTQIVGGRPNGVINIYDRLRGISTTTTSGEKYLRTSSTAAEASATGDTLYWSNTGFQVPSSFASYSTIAWNFKRAPGFFDVVCYTGTGVARTVNHNLGVAPELMILKGRSDVGNWIVYNNSLGNTNFLTVNSNNSVLSDGGAYFNSTSPTSSVFSLGTGQLVNLSGSTFVAYLFASCPGVSKVGSYTGTGDNGHVIDCGFANGARFVMIKETSGTGDWYVWDTARGIVDGTDKRLSLNSTAAEVTGVDAIDPTPSGFIINAQMADVNDLNATYIYLAIA